MQDVSFGFQAAAADVAGVPDDQLYRDLMSDCELGHRLGYDAAWLLEHHFAEPALDDGAYRGKISRSVAWDFGAGAALVSSAAARRGDRDA